MTDYDVIVIGCGPAGLMACGELAKRGISVLGIDKKTRLDKNNRTASGFFFVDQPVNGEYIKMTPKGSTTLLEYTRCGFSIEYSDTMEGIYHTHMFSDTGKHWQASTRKKPIYNTFIPTIWQADRYNEAKNNGAAFMPNTIALKVQQTNSRVDVTVRTNGKNKTLTCKKLIASDGLSSRTARNLGANKSRTFFGKGPTIEYEMVDVDCPYDRGDMFFFGSKNFGEMAGALIMVPSPNGKNAYRLETISILPASTATDIIDYFITKGPFAHWFKNAKTIDTSAAMVEMFSPIITPHLGNVLFVGDSAAFAECLYQCATMTGYMGAVCTEMELKGKKGFDEYTQFWGDTFEWVKNPKKMADYGKRLIFPRFFTIKELDFLFELSEKNPIVVDEVEASPFEFTTMVFQQFMSMPEVPDHLKERMQEIIDADMATVASVIGKVQQA